MTEWEKMMLEQLLMKQGEQNLKVGFDEEGNRSFTVGGEAAPEGTDSNFQDFLQDTAGEGPASFDQSGGKFPGSDKSLDYVAEEASSSGTGERAIGEALSQVSEVLSDPPPDIIQGRAAPGPVAMPRGSVGYSPTPETFSYDQPRYLDTAFGNQEQANAYLATLYSEALRARNAGRVAGINIHPLLALGRN